MNSNNILSLINVLGGLCPECDLLPVEHILNEKCILNIKELKAENSDG